MIRDPIDIKNSNIWQKTGKSFQTTVSSERITLILVGDQKAGKTSFIKLLKGDFDLESKPTRLIDYFITKKQGVQIELYEISSPKFQQALQFLIKTQNSSRLMIVLCVDLTKTQNLVNSINQKIQNLRRVSKQIVSNKKIDQIKSYNQERSKYYHFIQKNEDIEIIKRMPFRFSIIGCKYDLFDKMKQEEKKWACRCLRYLAHVNEANLLFSSTKNMQMCAQLRNILGQELFGVRNKTYTNQKDHNKPLYILTGQDKISQMSLPAFNNSGAFNELKILEQQLQSVFPSKKNIQTQQEKPKQFTSINLDYMINRQRKQIAIMMKDRNIKKSHQNYQTQKQTTFFQTGFKKASNTFQNATLNEMPKFDKTIQKPAQPSKPVSNKNIQQHYMDEGQDEQYSQEN